MAVVNQEFGKTGFSFISIVHLRTLHEYRSDSGGIVRRKWEFGITKKGLLDKIIG